MGMILSIALAESEIPVEPYEILRWANQYVQVALDGWIDTKRYYQRSSSAEDIPTLGQTTPTRRLRATPTRQRGRRQMPAI